MDKSALLKAILDELEKELRLLTDAANTAREEATDEESRAEDRYDMRSQSAAYLAAGQAKMAGETSDALKVYQGLGPKSFGLQDPIATGALVQLQGGGRTGHYFMGPLRGGMEVAVGNTTVIVLTASSPLGRQLLGRRLGDRILMPGTAKPVEHVISAVE